MFNWKKLFSLLGEFLSTRVGLISLLILTNILWYWMWTGNPRVKVVTTMAERIVERVKVDTLTTEKKTIINRFVDRIVYKERDPEVIRVVNTELVEVMPSVEITSIKVDPERMWVSVDVKVGPELVTYGTNYTRSKVELKPIDSTGVIVKESNMAVIGAVDLGINTDGNVEIGLDLLHLNILLDNLRVGPTVDLENRAVGLSVKKLLYPSRTDIWVGGTYFYDKGHVIKLSISTNIIRRIL